MCCPVQWRMRAQCRSIAFYFTKLRSLSFRWGAFEKIEAFYGRKDYAGRRAASVGTCW